MYEIVINDDADEELVAAAVFYESREPGLGEEFLYEFSKSLAKIRDRPLSSGIYFDHYRRYVMPRFPYGVVYRIEGEQILILAVAHVRRRPGYWRGRL